MISDDLSRPSLPSSPQPPPPPSTSTSSSFTRRPHRRRFKQRLASWQHSRPDRQQAPTDDHSDIESLALSTMPSLQSPSHPGGSSSHLNQKLKKFFRINTPNGVSEKDKLSSDNSSKTDSKASLRQPKRFFTTVGRLRSTTTASEGNPLDDVMSPTASANPYFAHQGQPGLRHHDTGSVPPSPPETPILRIDGPGGTKEHATNATKEELARKLRRVASAPNAQGLFSQGKTDGERPATAELGKEPLVQSGNASSLGLVDSKADSLGDARTLSVPADRDGLGALPPPGPNSLAFRRTYSANSIKIRTVEVGPSSFDKIKLIGKGDVGKVYLVREKKSTRLYAMKGQSMRTNQPTRNRC